MIRKKLSFAIIIIMPLFQLISNSKIYWLYNFLIIIVLLLEEKVLVKTKNYSFLLLLGVPILWALIFSINDSSYFIIQSLFYLTTPLIFTFLGIQLSRITDPKMVLSYVIYSGTIGALYYILISFYTLGINVILNPYEMRELVTWGSITNIITLILVFFSKESGFILFKNQIDRNIIAGINLLALYLTASRTYYLVFLIFVFFFLYHRNKKLSILAGILFAIGVGGILSATTDNKLINKIQTITTETSMGEYTTDSEINTKYRGFETFMALETYASGTPLNLAFGHGLEKQVDLGTYVMLGDSYRKVIPVLHNGYVYMLIKEGFFGLILFMAFFLKIIRLKTKNIPLRFIRKIVICSVISLMVTNFVIGTFFSSEMSILWLLFGIYIVHVEKDYKLEN